MYFYRLQIAVFTRIVAGEAAAARPVEWLRGIAVTAGIMLFQTEDNVGRVMREVGGTLCDPHMYGNRIRVYLDGTTIESTEVLERIFREGVPADIWVGSNLESELEYGNHRRATKYGEDAEE